VLLPEDGSAVDRRNTSCVICFVRASCWCFNKIKKTSDIGDYHSGVTEGAVTPIRSAFSCRRFERSYCPHPNVKQSKRIR